MAARNKRKRQGQPSSNGRQNGNRPQQSGSSTGGSNSSSSGQRQYTLSVDPATNPPGWHYQEQTPSPQQAQEYRNLLMEETPPQPSVPVLDDDVQLDYVDEGDAFNATGYLGGINYTQDDAWPETSPSPEYIQSFSQHDPLTTYNPEVSLRNYTVADHYLNQIQSNIIQLDGVVGEEQDETLQGIVIALQSILSAAQAGVRSNIEYHQGQVYAESPR